MKNGFSGTKKGISKMERTISEIQQGAAQIEKGIAGMKKGVRQMESRCQKLKQCVGKLNPQLPAESQKRSARGKTIAQVKKCLLALHGDTVPLLNGLSKFYGGNLKILNAANPTPADVQPPLKTTIA